LSLRPPLRSRNRGKKTVPTGTPAPTLLPKGRASPLGAGGIPTPGKLPASHLVPALVLSALKARQENRPNEKTTPSPKRCPEDLKARPLLRLRRLRRAVRIMARLPKDTAAIKAVPDPAGESGARSPGRLPAPSRPGPGLRLKGPRLAPAPFAQSYPFVCSLIAPPRPSRARPRSERGSCPCPRWSIWGWDPKEAQHLGGGGLPDTLSAGKRYLSFAKADFRAQRGPSQGPSGDLGAWRPHGGGWP